MAASLQGHHGISFHLYQRCVPLEIISIFEIGTYFPPDFRFYWLLTPQTVCIVLSWLNFSWVWFSLAWVDWTLECYVQCSGRSAIWELHWIQCNVGYIWDNLIQLEDFHKVHCTLHKCQVDWILEHYLWCIRFLPKHFGEHWIKYKSMK